MKPTLKPQEAQILLRAECTDPFAVLGMHAIDDGLAVRALRPDAAAVNVIERGGAAAVYPATRTHAEGLFEAIIVDRDVHFPYELEIEDYEGHIHRVRDPYSFWAQFSTQDQYLFNEGTHHRAYEALGAHPRRIDGVDGTRRRGEHGKITVSRDDEP